ncbi:lysoplasmalogenase family protein [Sediminibacter sp. Hel_I_10]|uniref:lysoplasmalogenase family protein n=1 Tax=Sediminibacter sp. Hel_I_10 TaxID=1392490 RepID=UPI00047D2DF1|nr:lysoplasmalogenase family protein [Sediminibacter sp. Hel_I_10]
MQRIFNNILKFSICYFSIVMIDLVFMTFSELEILRLVTKPALMLLLIFFYTLNDNESTSNNFVFTILALSFFLLANVMTYFKTEPIVLVAGSIFFILGKVCYVCRFSNNRDFNILQFLPFLAFYLLYMFSILNLTLDNLGSSLIPVLLFLFVTLLLVQFAFLRKEEVSKSSYILVMIGVFSFLLADTLSILGSFYKYWFYERFITMFVYASAQYMIIMGLVKEKIEPQTKIEIES